VTVQVGKKGSSWGRRRTPTLFHREGRFNNGLPHDQGRRKSQGGSDAFQWETRPDPGLDEERKTKKAQMHSPHRKEKSGAEFSREGNTRKEKRDQLATKGQIFTQTTASG